jgi:hypothetical protein
MNREQIVAILRRNASQFKENERFVDYLVDLTLYLLQYEYDWNDSDQCGPQTVASPKAPRPEQQAKPATKSFAKPPGTAPPVNPEPKTIRISGHVTPPPLAPADRECPHCGTEVDRSQLICPLCHNLTR